MTDKYAAVKFTESEAQTNLYLAEGWKYLDSVSGKDGPVVILGWLSGSDVRHPGEAKKPARAGLKPNVAR
jgi:hypothetical protein